MCGINGVFSLKPKNYSKVVEKMNSMITHRGPDNSGSFSSNYISLGQTRLSIIDLSSNGNQPMKSNEGRYVMVFNGEVYNFNDLKNKLDYNFISKTDSEVVLAAFIKWGADCVKHFNGMFSFAIWDNLKNELFIARDRMGIKPLYFFLDSSNFVFSSEIRSLMSSGFFPKELSQKGLVQYLQYQTVHAPLTIVNDVLMLESGKSATVKIIDNKLFFKEKYYWNINNLTDKEEIFDYHMAKKVIKEELSLAVEKRLYSDVASGAFLSGGIDSSVIVGLMSEVSSKKINTFNVSFNENEFNESKFARIIAKKFNTDHTEIKLSLKKFLEYIPLALKDMDHPSADRPNSWVVSKYTKDQGITMALSGLGGDELFAGYPVFNRMKFLKDNSWIFNMPNFTKNILKKIFLINSNTERNLKFFNILKLSSFNFKEIYKLTRKNFSDKDLSRILCDNRIANFDFPFSSNSTKIISQVSIAEMKTYMQNVLLRDSDQMGMAHSLEIRVPFLDHKLVESCLSFSDSIKYSKNQKKLLVDTFRYLLPKEIYNRKKMGFTFPWNIWLRNDLFDFSDILIKRISKRKYFNESEVLQLWKQFNDDLSLSFIKVWSLIVLEFWLTENDVN